MAKPVYGQAFYEDESVVTSLISSLNKQRKEHMFCDVVLKVSGEEIHAHSNVLAASSPYFCSFLGQGQDSPRAFSQKTPQIIEIHIEGSVGSDGYHEAVHSVIDFMYTGTCTVTPELLNPIREIAKITQMEFILSYCDHFEKGKSLKHRHITPKAVRRWSSGIRSSCGTQTPPLDEQLQAKILRNRAYQIYLSNPVQDVEKKKSKRGRPRKIDKPLITKAAELDHDYEANLKKEEDECDDDIDNEDEPELKKVKEEKEESNESVTEENNIIGSRLRKERNRVIRRPYSPSENETTCGKQEETKLEGNHMKCGMYLYRCPHCPYRTFNYTNQKRHMEAHTKTPAKYSCTECDFVAETRKPLEEHKRAHLHDKNMCSYCDWITESKEALNKHLENHKGRLKYFCIFCEARFKTRTQMNFHMPKHSEMKPFKCTICSQGFKWKHALKSHMVTHSNSKDHLCDICGFATAHKSQLKAHKLIHTGETYKCEFLNCSFQATKRQNLKYHMLTHTKEKPHQCDQCGQSFSLVKNMKRHMLLHTDERPCKCPMCDFSTTRYDKLKYHKMKAHSVGEEPKKRFRLSDYPKSMVPRDELLQCDNEHVGTEDGQTNDEEANTILSNIVAVQNTMNIAQGGITTDLKGHHMFLANPNGEPFPISLIEKQGSFTITEIENLQQVGVHFVTQVEENGDSNMNVNANINIDADVNSDSNLNNDSNIDNDSNMNNDSNIDNVSNTNDESNLDDGSSQLEVEATVATFTDQEVMS